MEVTSVKMFKRKGAGQTKAIASIVLDDAICINNIKVVENFRGLHINMPARRDKYGVLKDIAYPIHSDIREIIQEEIIKKYKEMG